MKYLTMYENFIMDTITEDSRGNDISQAGFVVKFEYLQRRFWGEYGHEVARSGMTNACLNWLQGSALGIEFTNHDIVQLLHKEGVVADVYALTDDEFTDVVNMYWESMARALKTILENG